MLGRQRGTQASATRRLLEVAEEFATQPVTVVMDQCGLSPTQAEAWQRLLGELAQSVREELGVTRRRGIRLW
jgi:ABC-type branched-subunit amino acid transport system ATPase component